MVNLQDYLVESKADIFSPYELNKLSLLKQDAIYNNLEQANASIRVPGIYGHKYFVKIYDPAKENAPEGNAPKSDYKYFTGVGDRYGRIFLQDADGLYLVYKDPKGQADVFRHRQTKKFHVWHLHKDGEDKEWPCQIIDLNHIPHRLHALIRQLKEK